MRSPFFIPLSRAAEMEEAAHILVEEIRAYNYEPNFYMTGEHFITITWYSGTVRCIISNKSIELSSFSGPAQRIALDDNAIQQAASQTMTAIVLEKDFTLEYYGDQWGVPNR